MRLLSMGFVLLSRVVQEPYGVLVVPERRTGIETDSVTSQKANAPTVRQWHGRTTQGASTK